MKLLTFDVGGTETKYAIIEDAIRISEQGYTLTPQESFADFSGLIKEIYDRFKDQVEGIAMTLPGPVDIIEGSVEKCACMRYPHDHRVAPILSEICGCKVIIENDGKAAALSEYKYGSIKICQNAAVFVVGTAVGGGLIINGDIVRGPRFMAGEFSFVNTEAEHYEEEYQIIGASCSTTFLLNRYKELCHSYENIDGRELFRRLPEDGCAQQALDELSRNIAIQIYNLYWLLDLEKVAIGGGISRQPILTEKIREKFKEVEKNAMSGRFGSILPIEIVPCRFANDANLIGSYITYVDHYDSVRY